MFFAIIKVKLKASKKMFPDTQCTVRCKAGLFVEMPFPFLFLPTSGEWLMKMCENDGFSKLHKKAKCSPGGRSALDPLIHTRKNAERFSSGPWIGSQTITSRHMCKKVSLRTCRFAQVIVCDCWSAKTCGHILVYLYAPRKNTPSMMLRTRMERATRLQRMQAFDWRWLPSMLFMFDAGWKNWTLKAETWESLR